MDTFGAARADHTQELDAGWRSVVTDSDIVLMPGTSCGQCGFGARFRAGKRSSAATTISGAQGDDTAPPAGDRSGVDRPVKPVDQLLPVC